MMHSAEATPQRGAGTKPPVGVKLGPDRPRADRLRLWHVLALAIVTLVCAGLTSGARGITPLAVTVDLTASLELTSPDRAIAVRSLAPQPSLRGRHARSRLVDLKAVEAETDDDDGDPLPHIADPPGVPVRGLFPRKRGRALRSALQIDTSRFAIDTGLPRGPPV